jgi:LysM repeat protein
MQALRDLGNALVIALISIGLVAGAVSISSVEFIPQQEESPLPSDALPSPQLLTATPMLPPTATFDFSLASATSSTIPSATITDTPPANCQIPSGWIQIVVQPGETLDSISARYRISSAQVQIGNCLPTSNLVSGTKLYVPPVAPNTVTACIPGAVGWTKSYSVRPGDNLYRIGIDHYTTLDLMRHVNCRVGDTIYVGELLWVPNVASRTPPPSPLPGSTVTAYPTDPLTETALPFTATILPMSTLPNSTLPATTQP